MRGTIRTFGLLALLSLASWLSAQDQKSQSGKKEKSEPARKEALIAIGAFGGKVMKASEDGKTFELRVYGQTPQLKFTPGNPASCWGKNRVSRFGITLKNTHQDVTITLADAVKVRTLPQPEYDDKGRIKPFKPDPKDADRNLGGVKGAVADVRKDVWIVADLKRTLSGSLHVAHLIMVLGEEEKK